MKQLFIFLIATVLLGCRKHAGDTDLVPSRKFSFLTARLTSPRDGQQFSPGQSVSITGTITADQRLEKVRLVVTNRVNGAEVLRVERYLDANTYNLSEAFTVEASQRYIMKLEAWDQYSNKAETQLGVVCN